MSQDWGIDEIIPGTTSPATDITKLANALKACQSNHSGAARPANVVASQTWVKVVSATAHEVYYFDGADDVLMGTLNPTANTWSITYTGTLTGSAGEINIGSGQIYKDASGNLMVGTMSVGAGLGTGHAFVGQYGPVFKSTGGAGYEAADFWNVAASGTIYQCNFRDGASGTPRGSITTNGSTTAYNTSSDYRLKNIAGPITNSGAYIDSLNPVEGTWKADGSIFVGLIAHQVQEASRTQVAVGEKDGELMQGMDYSNAELVANMIAELKSIRSRLAALEARLP